MTRREQVFRTPGPDIRSLGIAGLAALLVLVAGCERQREPAGEGKPSASLERAGDTFAAELDRNLLRRVAGAQSRRAGDTPVTKTPGESAADAAHTQPDGTQPKSGRSSGGPKPGDLEDKTLRDFTKRRCLDSGCHARLDDTPRVHGPVAVGACHLCHEAQGQPGNHRFKPARRKEELCSLCHRPAEPLAVVHEPYGKFACTDCHDPHGGHSTKFLRAETTDGTCRLCHERREAAVAHKPVAEGDCLACHASHQSNFEHLLVVDEEQLCLGCHVEQVTELKESAHVHGPVAEGCTECHQSHGSGHVALLREEPQQLCLGCHEDTTRGAADAKSGHGFFAGTGTAAARCSDCHRPHASNFDKLLVDARAQMCFTCHDRRLELPSGRTIASVRQEIDTARFVHEPVSRGDCGTCHLAHFSSHPTLLKGSYPADFYAEFSPATYALCFSCHDRRLATEERTNRTQFRDGDRNLHFLHVNRKKGRTCGVCHTAHASRQPAQVRESVSFGPSGWELPIRFQRNASGGTCSTGCHQEYSYDNTTPPPPPKEESLPGKPGPAAAPPATGGDGE